MLLALLAGAALIVLLLNPILLRLSGVVGVRFGDAGSVDTFKPEIWSKKLLLALTKAHGIASSVVVNRDYEGEISEADDTMRINSVGAPTIQTYVPSSTTITPEALTTAQRSLVVDQAKFFAFEVDDVDRRQALGGAFEEALRLAADGLVDVVEVYLEALMRTGVAAGNALGAITVTSTTPTDVLDKILMPMSVKLTESNVPTDGRFALIPAWVEGLLRLDKRFIEAQASGDASQAMGNKVIGQAGGFKIVVSNNLPLVTGDDYSIIAGHPMATSYAEQINKVEAYRPESSFSDAVKGLHLYGAKVVRPTALCTALASKT